MTTWREALADCKATLIVSGVYAAQVLATEYLAEGTLTPGDYIALVRWSEGRPSYASTLWSVTP